MIVCDKCGQVNADGSVFCLKCGHMIGFGNGLPRKPGQPAAPQGGHPGTGSAPTPPNIPNQQTGGSTSSVIDKLNEFIGNDAVEPLKWTDLFTSVFKKHSFQEAEDLFIYGTRRTTPPLYAVSSEWPKPWLYSRVLIGFVICFFFLKICVDLFGSIIALPGLIVIGSMAFPLSMVVLFLEVNVFRNISFYSVSLIFLLGSGAAILSTLILYFFLFPDSGEMGYFDALLVGIIEETGKFLIIFFFLYKLPNCHYILNGLLVGAVVGAGFAALESAGYAFTCLLGAEDMDEMYSIIYLRGFLAPGGHIAWSAIVGAAIVLCGRSQQGKIAMDRVLGNGRFWKIVLFPVVLHFLWDCPFMNGVALIKCILLFVAAWVVALTLIQMGLKEVDKAARRN